MEEKTSYISADGLEFGNKTECIRHEAYVLNEITNKLKLYNDVGESLLPIEPPLENVLDDVSYAMDRARIVHCESEFLLSFIEEYFGYEMPDECGTFVYDNDKYYKAVDIINLADKLKEILK